MNAEEVARVAERELEVYSALQSAIHYIPADGEEPPPGGERRKIEDLFVPFEPTTISWHSTPQLTYFSGVPDHNSIKFLINYYFSRVFSFYVSMTLPRVAVLDKYRGSCRIAWSPNVAANLLGRGRVIYGKAIAEDFPVYADDIERQFNCPKPGQQETRMRDSGSVSALTSWSTVKPQFGPLYATPNFHFTRDLSHCIRASLLDDRSQVTVAFAPRAFQQVLRMKVLRRDAEGLRRDAEGPSAWVSIPCDMSRVRFEEPARSEALENQALPYTAKGEVIVANKDQRSYEANCSDSFANYFKHYKVLEKVHVRFGEVAEIEVTDQSICVAMFINAFNERAPLFGCHSNYTTNPEDPAEGADPIKTCELYYDQTLAKSYDAYYMANIEPRKFPSMPIEVGYHAISFLPSDPFSVSPHSLRGLVPGKLKLRVKVTLNSFSPDMMGAERDDKFTVVLTMMMVRKLEYRKLDEGADPAFSIALSE